MAGDVGIAEVFEIRVGQWLAQYAGLFGLGQNGE